MREIWFIRHAESAANAGLATSDPATIPLTERGWAQARAVAAVFTQPPSLVITTPHVRTRLTAQPTLERFPDVACVEWPMHEFTYLGFAHDQATTQAERKPLGDAYWARNDPNFVHGAGAESFAAFIGRVADALLRLATLEPGLTAIFCHGWFTRALLWSWLSGGVREPDAEAMNHCRAFIHSIAMPNAAIIKALVTDEGELFVGTVSTAHLRSL